MKWYSAVVMGVLLAGSVQAAPPSRESVEKLITVSNADASYKAIASQFEPMMRQSMLQAAQQKNEGKPLTEAQTTTINKAATRMATLMRDEFPMAELKAKMADLYMEVFEQQEVDEMLAFYNSPSGQSMLNKMPLVAQKSMTMTQDLMKPFAAKMQQAAKEMAEEMKAVK